MLTIDEAIAREKQLAEVWSEEHEQIAKWLEEFKTLKENSISKEAFEKMKSRSYQYGYRQGYAKAIDDFATFMKAAINQDYVTTTPYGPITYNRLIDKCNEIADELKEMNK